MEERISDHQIGKRQGKSVVLTPDKGRAKVKIVESLLLDFIELRVIGRASYQGTVAVPLIDAA